MKPIPYRGHLILPADNRVAVMVPHAKTFEHNGQTMMLVPHKVDETQVLRNLGYDVKPPVLLDYDWCGTEPFDAQRITTALITTHRRCFVLNGLGTGKTRSALFAFDYMRKSKAINGALLVTAPLSTLRQTWEREVAMVFPHLRCSVLHARSKAKRIALLDDPADVYITNHDGVEVLYYELLERARRFSMVVLDELSTYKNANTELWKKTNKVVSLIDRVVGMTATPMPTAATDAYGQIKIIAPQAVRGVSFGRFRETMMTRVSEYRWVNRRDAVERVYALMQPAVRFSRDECYDLPPCQVVNREVALTDHQRRLFLAMQAEAAIPELDIAAVNAADLGNKLLQIALGVVYDRNHRPIPLDVSPRLKELDAIVEESASKVIVFTPYKSTLSMLVDHLKKRWTVDFVSGDVHTTQREKIFTAFMHTPDPHVLVAHPECMSHGLTLTEASTIVWWGPPSSLETYEQANGRITRAGQRHSQLIVNMMGTRLEARVFKLLESRANVQRALLEMFERQDRGDLS